MKNITKILGFIGFGLSILVMILLLMSALIVEDGNGKALLILLAVGIPFIILGLVGTLKYEKNKMLSGVFMILAGIATAFLGFMSVVGGVIIGGLNLAVGFIAGILYIVAAIFCFINNNKEITQST